MKKVFRYLLLLISLFFIAASLFMMNQQKAQRTLQAEVKEGTEPLVEIHDLLFQARNAKEDEKKVELILQAQEKLREFGKSFSERPVGVVRCVIQPKYVLLLHLAGMKEEAAAALKEGIQNIETLHDPEVEAAIYINMAECSVECRDSASFEFCFQKASERMEASTNTKWKSDMTKTLENLRILASERMPK
ncbi:MAG: hypothetical protein K6C40_06035 [Thermoguttaceae bacterium]|nr:hypothetical protein [Thermoguttaceae bacterium]